MTRIHHIYIPRWEYTALLRLHSCILRRERHNEREGKDKRSYIRVGKGRKGGQRYREVKSGVKLVPLPHLNLGYCCGLMPLSFSSVYGNIHCCDPVSKHRHDYHRRTGVQPCVNGDTWFQWEVLWLSAFFSGRPLGVRSLNRSSRKMAQTTRIRARMCLLEWKLKVFVPPDPQPPKTAKTWPILVWT